MTEPTPTDHLTPRARTTLSLPDAERIARIQEDRWIPYPRANEFLDELEDLRGHVKTLRMPNALVVGETNNGKTALVRRFLAQHPSRLEEETAKLRVPVLYVQAPSAPDVRGFYDGILETLCAPTSTHHRTDAKQRVAISLLRDLEVKVLVIDEIHQILGGTHTRRVNFLNELKYLGNELQISMVPVGTYAAFHVLASDPQMANRFPALDLPVWKPGEEWERLLVSFERRIPLRKPSNLAMGPLCERLFTMSEGLLGELWTILRKTACAAVSSGSERIDNGALDRLRWVPASRRSRRQGSD